MQKYLAQLGYAEATKLLVDGGASVFAINGVDAQRLILQKRRAWVEHAIKALDDEPSTSYVLKIVSLL